MSKKQSYEYPVPKTAEGLRDALFDEINAIRAGSTSLQKSRALAQLASQLIDSMRVQIQYGRLIQQNKDSGTQLLGSGK